MRDKGAVEATQPGWDPPLLSLYNHHAYTSLMDPSLFSNILIFLYFYMNHADDHIYVSMMQ